MAPRALTFVNSHKLYEQLQPIVPNLIETRTTTLSETDFFARDDTCQKHLTGCSIAPGRMDRGKGLMQMVEALAVLVEQGQDLVLDLVGWPQKGDAVLNEIAAVTTARGIDNHVIYHGFKALGPELFAFYKNADIFVIASQNSEGFPRAIWKRWRRKSAGRRDQSRFNALFCLRMARRPVWLIPVVWTNLWPR